MGIKFRYNDKTYSLAEEFSVNGLTSSNNLVYEFNTGSSSMAEKYIPAFETRGSKLNIGNSGTTRRYVDNSAPTICFRINNKTYYCAKSLKHVFQCTVSYNSNGGTGSMDSQSFYPDDGESVTIKANSFTRSGYSFVSWNTSSDGSGTAYSPGAKFSGNGLSLYAQWKINFSASGWAAAYSSSNTWQETNLGNWKVYKHTQHFYNFTVKVTAPSSNVYDFIIVSNSGNWTAELVSNPDIPMNGSTTKTMSVQVRFKSTLQSGDPVAHLTIGLRDRTNSVNTVVSQYSFSTALSFGTTDSEE